MFANVPVQVLDITLFTRHSDKNREAITNHYRSGFRNNMRFDFTGQ